jgi:hypothetical protein
MMVVIIIIFIMARRIGSKDKVKREKRNQFGLTRSDLINERKKTRNYAIAGSAVGGTIGYGVSRKLTKRFDANIKLAQNNLDDAIARKPTLMNDVRLSAMNDDVINQYKNAINKTRNATRLLKVATPLAGAAIGTGITMGYLANQRAKKQRNRLK